MTDETPVYLAGDIGGTKTLLRLAAPAARATPEAPALEVLAERSYASKEFPDLVPMVREFLAAVDGKPDAKPAGACFGCAGPVFDNSCELTNLPWSLDGGLLQRELAIPRVRLLNDFAAIGYGILGLRDEDLRTLQPNPPDPEGPIAVIGAGTGLGAAFLIPRDGRYRVYGSEGSHATFAPRSELDAQLRSYLKEADHLQHVSVERVASGMGITSVYQFLRDRRVAAEAPAMAEVFQTWKREIGRDDKTVDLAAEISKAAIGHGDYLCRQTMRLFLEAYGAAAGNLALHLLPLGGLYVAGGIAPKILPLFEQSWFLDAFRDKGRLAPILERVPVHVVLDPRVGVLGASLEAARMS